jgi:hypothetical protein
MDSRKCLVDRLVEKESQLKKINQDYKKLETLFTSTCIINIILCIIILILFFLK